MPSTFYSAAFTGPRALFLGPQASPIGPCPWSSNLPELVTIISTGLLP